MNVYFALLALLAVALSARMAGDLRRLMADLP
jgi:hypothetical protein